MYEFKFDPVEMHPCTAQLRTEVREFLRVELAQMLPQDRAKTWFGFSADFSRKFGARGWIGMTWPKKYGGQERSALERYVIVEELLAAGAPVAAHWMADRQTGELLLRYGSDNAKNRFLPAIARGELYFCVGLSEPVAGSDLAAIRTSAVRVSGGWQVNGSKIWTSGAPHSHMMSTLLRTSGSISSRHAGLSQLIIDLSSPGVTVRPITDQTGDRHFAEVFFTDVFVPDDMLLGNEGEGWQQVNAELSLERSGPERYLSCYRLIEEFVRAAGPQASLPVVTLVGEIISEMWTLRQMSTSVTGQLSSGGTPALEAIIVKDLGSTFEQSLPPRIQAVLGAEMPPSQTVPLHAVLNYLLNASPSFSLRGGTREILRGMIARGLELR
ncbi:MAG: acyl-CoA dehydrogenase [Gammaproteobacteria bacterium]|nr:acyl-CoA dehydrogenase [Gammaproteobacteria bacterium]